MNPPVLISDIDYETGIAEIQLNRPEVHNAFDELMIQALTDLLQDVEKQDNVRMTLLKASGNSFCSGGDLNWMKRMAQASVEENKTDAVNLAKLLYTLDQLKKPTIAMVQGLAYGGGVGLLACCDIVVASHNAKFCLSEVKVGLVPSVISPYVVKAMGERAARRYFLTAEAFSTIEAHRLGLVHVVTDESELETKTKEICMKIHEGGPLAQQKSKQLIKDVSQKAIDESIIDYTSTLIAEIRKSEEGQEGLQAFLEKRKPSWIKDVA